VLLNTELQSIAKMFSAIDECAWPRLSEYFHDDVVYIRPGYDPIRGLADLLDFYAHRRIIAKGKHTIEETCVGSNGNMISATGSFTGVDRSGKTVEVRFCDVYVFQTGKIRRRETFFNSPAV
jgi:ketosteroid isomerase-like protein